MRQVMQVVIVVVRENFPVVAPFPLNTHLGTQDVAGNRALE